MNKRIIEAITENKITANIEELMKNDIKKAEEKRLKELFLEAKILSKKEVIKQAKKDYESIGTEWTKKEYIEDILQALEDDGYTLTE